MRRAMPALLVCLASCGGSLSSPEGAVRAKFEELDRPEYEDQIDFEISALEWELDCLEIEAQWKADPSATRKEIDDGRKKLDFLKETRGDRKEATLYVVEVGEHDDGTRTVSTKIHTKDARYDEGRGEWRLDDSYDGGGVRLTPVGGDWKIKK